MNFDVVDFYCMLLNGDDVGDLVEVNFLFLYLVVLGVSDFFVFVELMICELLFDGVDLEKLFVDF